MVRATGEIDAILPPSVLKNIGDKLYEKRKQAALEVEQIVKQKSSQGSQDKVSIIIEKLVQDYAKSTSANHRKGGLLCLAAIAVGLGGDDNDRFLSDIVPPVLESFRDPDGGVRYYGLEALYNIAKVSRESFLRYFSDTFDSLFRLCADAESRVQNAAMILDNMIKDIVAACEQFEIERFIPRLAQFLAVPHVPHKRRFLIDWTSLLQSVPDIDMLLYLPQLLDGMMTMLSDSHTEIRTAAGRTLENFLRQIEKAPDSTDFAALTRVLVAKAKSSDDMTRYTAIRWLNSFLSASFLPASHDSMMAFMADLIIAVLPCLSHSTKDIKEAAASCNSRLLSLNLSKHLAAVGIGPVLTALSSEVTSEQQPTRLESLRWFQVLLQHNKDEVLRQWNDIMPALLDALTASSDAVVKQALLVHVKIAQDEQHFNRVLRALLERFHGDAGLLLLQKRGTLILRGLCGLLGGTKVFSELATILEAETDSAFAASMTQALNLLLLTAPELAGLRGQLQNALHDPEAAQLLRTLYSCWCHSAVAGLSLCMLAQAYTHVDAMIHALAELPLLPVLLAQVDRFVMLIDSPVFTRARLHLLSPGRYPNLMRAMYSLLMLCPQSNSFNTLHARLSSVPTLALLKLNDADVDGFAAIDGGSTPLPESSLPWRDMLQTFRERQQALVVHHEEHEKLPWPAQAAGNGSAAMSAFLESSSPTSYGASVSAYPGTPTASPLAGSTRRPL